MGNRKVKGHPDSKLFFLKGQKSPQNSKVGRHQPNVKGDPKRSKVNPNRPKGILKCQTSLKGSNSPPEGQRSLRGQKESQISNISER